MEQEQGEAHAHSEADTAAAPELGKQPWHEPKLTFVTPKLTRHGTVNRVTGQGFFGSFQP
jgi:hypothetical protein